MENEVDLNELREITNKIFDHILRDVGIERLKIADDRDYYWDIPSEALFHVKQAQPTLDVGRLRDDWEFLAKLSGGSREEAVALMLLHVAPLLRFIGEEIGQ